MYEKQGFEDALENPLNIVQYFLYFFLFMQVVEVHFVSDKSDATRPHKGVFFLLEMLPALYSKFYSSVKIDIRTYVIY